MTQKSYSDRFKEMTYADRQRADGRWPVVLRLAGMKPADVKAMIAHALRKIGDVSHTDPRRRELNDVLIGDNEIGERIEHQCAVMKRYNRISNNSGLRKLGRKKDREELQTNGPGDPWHGANNSDGPLREIIISVHRDHFLADENCPPEHVLEFLDDEGEMTRHDLRKHKEFKEAGKAFLQQEYGSACVYARYDLDENSGHLHALISDRVHEPPSKRNAYGRWIYRTMCGCPLRRKDYFDRLDR